MGSCLDLRQFQDVNAVEDAFSKIVSGRSGYKTVLDRRIDPVKCEKCGKIIEGAAKFCPDCGTPVKRKSTTLKCVKCNTLFEGEEQFCRECGSKRD